MMMMMMMMMPIIIIIIIIIIMEARDIRSIFSPLWQPVRHLKVTTAMTGSIELNLPLLCIY
jgi:hypothetical protein